MKKRSHLTISGDWTAATEHTQGQSWKEHAPCDSCPEFLPTCYDRRITSAQNRKKVA